LIWVTARTSLGTTAVGVHYQKCIQTLHCSWHEGYRTDIKAIARQAPTNTVWDKLLNAKAIRWEDAQGAAASLCDFPLTWRRNTQIQMYWLWKRIESYNNCTFSTWKDKCLFNFLFCIPNSFCTFHDHVGQALSPLPSPTAGHWFLSFRILNTLRLPWKTELPWTFSLCWNIFYLSGLLSNLRLPWKIECALKSLYWKYIFYHSQFWTTCTCPGKQSLPWKFSLHWNIFLSFRIF